jgi:hypothetical protein
MIKNTGENFDHLRKNSRFFTQADLRFRTTTPSLSFEVGNLQSAEHLPATPASVASSIPVGTELPGGDGKLGDVAGEAFEEARADSNR